MRTFENYTSLPVINDTHREHFHCKTGTQTQSKNVKERLQNTNKKKLHSYLPAFSRACMCEDSRYFRVTSTKVQAAGKVI